MLDDIVWNLEPQFGLLALCSTMTFTAAALVWNIVSYLKSKSPPQSTIMDFVTICFVALLLCMCLILSTIFTTMTIVSGCGDTIATAMTSTIAIISHTLHLEILPLVSLQVICTLYPWILESSAFEKIYKMVVLVIMPSISAVIFVALRHLSPQLLWYAILRGQGSSTDTSAAIIYFVSLALVFAISASGRIFIYFKTKGESPNYIIRLEVAALVTAENLALNLLVPHSYLTVVAQGMLLQFIIVISVTHFGVRTYALNRPFIRPLVVFYRTRLARRVTSLLNDPSYTVEENM